MATEAEISESITKKEGEIIDSASGQFDSTVDDTSPGELKKFQGALNVPPGTIEYSTETKNMQAANDVGTEAMNTVSKVDVETPEGDKFLGSPSTLPVAIEDTCRVSKNSEPEELILQAGNEMLESDKQVEITGDKRTEESKVTEENNMSHVIVKLTEASLLMAKIEESNLMIKEESLKEERIIENKEEKPINLMDEVPETTKPSERVADEDEKEKSMHEGAEETFTPTIRIKSDEEATLTIREEAGHEATEKLQEASSISYDEKSKDKIEPNNEIECMAPVEDEMNHKNDMDTELLKVVPKIWSEGIIKENPDEIKEQIEISEKTAESDSTSNETGKEYDSLEQKGDGSFMIHEGTLSENELLPAKEASSGENRYEEESSVTATKDNTVEDLHAFEHSEERPEKLQQNEPLNAVAEDFNITAETITSIKDETTIKIQEKNFEEEIKKDFPNYTEANVPLIELNEKTECGEAEVPNKNANDLHVTDALVEEAGQSEGKNLDKVFNSEPEGKIQEAYDAYTTEERQIEDAPEECPSVNSTILEQTSMEGEETTELTPKASETDIEKLQEASGPDFEGKSVMVDDGENTDQEMQKNGEACDTVTQEILTDSTHAGKCTEASDELNNAVAREEKIKQNIQVESPLDSTPELTSQDERCIAEDNNNRNNITNEEEHDGSKTAATLVAINEQVIEDMVTQISPESIEKQNVESCEGNKNVAENSEGKNNREQVTEDSNIRCLLPESLEQVPINDLKCEKKEAEESTEEILENSDTAEDIESITHETIKTIESPEDILDGSTVQQGESSQGEERNLTPIETSLEEEKTEDTLPAIVVEKNGGDSEPVAAEDNIETKIAESEEDLKHLSEKNELGEELSPSLSMPFDNKEVFNSEADKTLGDVEEGPIQNLEEALLKEENEKETEVKNDTEYSKTAMEEEFKPTSLAQLYQDSNAGGKDEENEKCNIKEECGTTNILPEPIGKESLQSSTEEKVDQSIELQEEKIEHSSQGDESKQGNDTYVEETNCRGLVPESVEQSPVKNLEDDEMKEDKPTGEEIAENSKTTEVAESAARETNTTIGSITKILDTSQLKQGEFLENEENNQIATEYKAPQKEHNDKETEEKNETKDDNIAVEENIEIVPESSDASKNTDEGELLELKLEEDKMLAQDEIKKEESEELYEDSKKADESKSEKHNTLEECSAANTFSEPIEEKTQQSFEEEEKEEETPKTEVCVELDTASVGEDAAEKQIAEGENTFEQSRELEVEKFEKSSKENDVAAKMYKEEECEKTQIANSDDDTGRQNIEKGGADETKFELLTRGTDIEDSVKENEEKEHDKQAFEAEVSSSTETQDIVRVESLNDQVKEEIVEPNMKEIEIAALKQVDDSNSFTEETEATSSAEETVSETLKDRAESNAISYPLEVTKESDAETPTIETSGDLIEESATVSHASNKETEKEIGENEETIINDSDSASISVVTEEKGLQEAEPEDKKQIERVCPAVEEKSVTEIETKGATLESVDVSVKPADTSDLGEKRDNETPTVADKANETNEGLIEESAMLSHTPNKETEEEITERGETTIEESGSSPITVVTETKGLREAEPEDREQVESVDPAFEDKNIAEIETKATTLESLDNNVEPEVTSDLGEKKDNGIPTVADTAGETNEGLIEEYAVVSHASNKEPEEEIKEKEEACIEDSDSASITVVSEAKGQQQAEPEEKKQVESVDTAFEEKGMTETETKETTLENADINMSPVDPAHSSKKRDNENPTVADEGSKTNGGLNAEYATVSHASNRETKEAIEQKEEISIVDAESTSITVVIEEKGLQEAEPEDRKQVENVVPASEEEGIAQIETKETTLETVDISVKPEDDLNKRDDDNSTAADHEIPTVTVGETNEDLIEESAMVSHTQDKETKEEIKEKEETTIDDSDSVSITTATEAKGSQEAEPEDKRPVESSGPVFEEKGMAETETKETPLESVDINMSLVDTTDLSKKRDNENPTVADEGSETNGGPNAEYATVSHASNKETKEASEQKEEISIVDSDFASITVAIEEKGLQEAEPEDIKQVENIIPASEEEGIAEIETKETTLESVDISVKPEDDLNKRDDENSTAADHEIPTITDTVGETNEDLIEESAMVSHTQDKETEEEIKEKEETTVDDSGSVSITAVAEAKGSQEAKPEDKKRVESVGPAFDQKDMAETETKETTLESVDINVKAEDTSDLGEERDKEIPNVTDEAREIIECEIQNDVPDAGSEDEIEVITTDKSLEEISTDGLVEYPRVTLKEQKPTTTEVRKRVDDTPAQDQALFENTETTCVARAIDKMPMNEQDTTTNAVNVSELESVDVGKETANEEVQKQKVEHENTENFSKSEDVEISKGKETGKLADQDNVYESTTSKDEESLNLGLEMGKTEDEKPLEILKTFETSGERTESEKAILEEEISAGNLKENEVEIAAAEPEGEAHFQRHEDVNNTDDGTATKEKLECTSEAVAENQTSETLPESDKRQVEENSSDNQNQEHDKEIEEKEESQLEAEEHKEQNANETTKDVILTEKEQEGLEQSDDSEDFKERVVDEDRGINQLHVSSTGDETTDEMEYDKAVDSKEQAKAEKSEIEEDLARETEASLARESEEQKSQDIKIESDLKESKEKIEDNVEESPEGCNKTDDTILTAKTERSPGEAKLRDKLEKDFHVEATETDNSQQVKEADNMKLEETPELVAEFLQKNNGHAETESIIVENIDVIESEETKIASETVSEPKDLAKEEALVGNSQTVEKPDQIPTNNDDKAGRKTTAMENTGADEAEETKIISIAVVKAMDLGAEETAEAVKGQTAENIDQIQSGDCKHTQKESVALENPKADEVNEIKVVSNETYESKNQETEESYGEISTVGNIDVGEPEETKIASEAVFESKVQGAEEAEVGKSQTVETTDQKLTNNDDNKERENAAMENSGADEVETKIVADEIKVVSDSKGQGAEEAETGESQTVEKPDQVATDDDDLAERKNEAMENAGADEVEQVKTVSDAVDEAKDQGAGETAETGNSPIMEKMDQIPTSNCEHAQKASVAIENPKADEVNEIKVVSDATYKSNIQDTEEYDEEISTVEKLNQTAAANSEQAEKERVIMQYPDVEEVKDRITEDIDEAGKNSTKHDTDDNKIEEAGKAASTIETVTESEIIVEQTSSLEKPNVQLPTLTSTLPFTDETTATVEKIEEEKPQVEKLEDEVLEVYSAAKPTDEIDLQSRELEVSTLGFIINKDMLDSSTQVYEEEGHTPDEALKLEPREDEKQIKCADSSSETDQSMANTDLTGLTEKACILESEASEKAPQSEAIIPSLKKPTRSEDTEIKDKHLEVISDERTEEIQLKKNESNEISENEVSKEEITAEKEVAETCQPISLGEGTLNKSVQEDAGLKAEECRGDEMNDPLKITVNGIQYEEPSMETEMATKSTNIREQAAVEDKTVEHSEQVSVENKTIKGSFPHEIEGKNVEDSAIKLDTESLGEESNLGSAKTEATAPRDEESNMEMSKKESINQFAKVGGLIQETHESKESSYAITEKQIPTQAELIEHPDTLIQTENEYDPPVWLEGITETTQKAEVGDLKPGNAEGVRSEAEVKHDGEQRTDCSGQEPNEGTVLVDSTKASLSDLFHKSRKETSQAVKQFNKETEQTALAEENQTIKSETIQVKEPKVDEEKEEEDGREHNGTDTPASDAPVMVEASRDMDAKAAHKKSHSILSGVGSKVKHSISKVKKAITGKSSHSK